MSHIVSDTGPGKPSEAQKMHLAEAVRKAYDAGWKGNLREKKAPALARWVPRRTRISLRSKRLLSHATAHEGVLKLTKQGVEVGEAAHVEIFGASASDRAEVIRRGNQEREQREQDRKERIKHLFRGLYLRRKVSYGARGKKARSVASHLDRSTSLHLNQEDLLELGEGIEKLRENQPK